MCNHDCNQGRNCDCKPQMEVCPTGTMTDKMTFEQWDAGQCFINPYRTKAETDHDRIVWQAATAQAEQRGAARADVLCDSNYIAGMKHGWNCAVINDTAGYEEAIRSRLRDRAEHKSALADELEGRK